MRNLCSLAAIFKRPAFYCITFAEINYCYLSCFSSVGLTGDRKQELSIGNGCEDHGTVVHEIGK